MLQRLPGVPATEQLTTRATRGGGAHTPSAGEGEAGIQTEWCEQRQAAQGLLRRDELR